MMSLIDKFSDKVQQVMDNYLLGFFENDTTQRTVITPINFVVQDVDYVQYIEFVGTAHFSERSLLEVTETVRNVKPIAVGLELCPFRYEFIREMCNNCQKREDCVRRCEFVATIDTLNIANTHVWLIDMTQEEITARVLSRASSEEAIAWKRLENHVSQRELRGMRLWEEGLKNEAMRLFRGDLELMRKTFPTLWKVLILERNTLMGCRIIHIISDYLQKGESDFKIVVLMGAAHVEGVKKMLKRPRAAFRLLNKLGISFSLPYLVRRKKE